MDDQVQTVLENVLEHSSPVEVLVILAVVNYGGCAQLTLELAV